MFKKIDVKELNFNVIDAFKNKWALLSVGNLDEANTMTIAWGMLGCLWKKDVAIVYVRPSRYTFKMLEENEYYTIAFFDESYKDVLTFCGKNSKRDIDKIKYCNLHLKQFDNSVSLEEASCVLVIKKLYTDDFKERLLSEEIKQNCYPQQDYSRQYIGEIINCYIKK